MINPIYMRTYVFQMAALLCDFDAAVEATDSTGNTVKSFLDASYSLDRCVRTHLQFSCCLFFFQPCVLGSPCMCQLRVATRGLFSFSSSTLQPWTLKTKRATQLSIWRHGGCLQLMAKKALAACHRSVELHCDHGMVL
jgi:hypothetical protein